MICDDGRKAEAKAIPILEVANRLGIAGLRRVGVERVGPCPVCGGRDRFGINPGRGVFVCRGSDTGGDGLALVQYVQGCDFQAALDFLVGEATGEIDPALVAARRQKMEAEEKRRQEYEGKARAWAIRDAREIWHAAQPGEDNSWRNGAIALPGWPVTGVSEIRYIDTAGDTQILDHSSAFRLVTGSHPAGLVRRPDVTLPQVLGQVAVIEIDYTLGQATPADVDAGLITALALIAGHYYENREATATSQVVEVPLGARHILARFQRGIVA